MHADADISCFKSLILYQLHFNLVRGRPCPPVLDRNSVYPPACFSLGNVSSNFLQTSSWFAVLLLKTTLVFPRPALFRMSV